MALVDEAHAQMETGRERERENESESERETQKEKIIWLKALALPFAVD